MLQEHYKLFEGATSKVGELHYLILKSQEIVEKLKRNDKSFEEEIGRDEIHWWIFHKEKDLKELKNRTGEVLEAFQRVKEDSVKLRQLLQPRTYSELIEGMKKFCIDHESEIQALLDYVKWLATKDPNLLSYYSTTECGVRQEWETGRFQFPRRTKKLPLTHVWKFR